MPNNRVLSINTMIELDLQKTFVFRISSFNLGGGSRSYDAEVMAENDLQAWAVLLSRLFVTEGQTSVSISFEGVKK